LIIGVFTNALGSDGTAAMTAGFPLWNVSLCRCESVIGKLCTLHKVSTQGYMVGRHRPHRSMFLEGWALDRCDVGDGNVVRKLRRMIFSRLEVKRPRATDENESMTTAMVREEKYRQSDSRRNLTDDARRAVQYRSIVWSKRNS
jgi:hypothetical protein